MFEDSKKEPKGVPASNFVDEIDQLRNSVKNDPIFKEIGAASQEILEEEENKSVDKNR